MKPPNRKHVRDGNVTLIISGEREISYSEIQTRIAKAATGLRTLGLRDGRAVAMMLRNDFALFEVSGAAAALGSPVVPINWHLKAEEVAYILADSGADILVCHADLLPQIRDGLPGGLTLMVVATPPEIAMAFNVAAVLTEVPEGMTDWDVWRDSHAPLQEPPIGAAPMFYTSGTTGRPKGVRRKPTPPEQMAASARVGTITYAATGDQLKYWTLFPAPDGFGNVPVWGFGEVIASKHPNVAVGEILFGYFPMATHLVIEATEVSKRALRDGAAHRQGVAPVYNAYARVGGDPAFAGQQGDHQALLRPLLMLSFLVDDHLAENEFYGARRVLLSSASSKTAFGLAHLLQARADLKVIGLTSAPNADFVNSLGCYHEVVTYDRVSSLPSDSPVALVDMAGNSGLREKLHRQFGHQMKYSGRIGLTHRSSSPDEPELPGARPTWFFAPEQIRKRAKEWGPGGIDTRFNAAWAGFAPMLDQWLKVVVGRGPDDVKQVYLDTLNGRVPPDRGHILSLAMAHCSLHRSTT